MYKSIAPKKFLKTGFLLLGSTYLPQLKRLAYNYPFPHNVLGTIEGMFYVENLYQKFIDKTNEGWFGIVDDGYVKNAAHLSQYGKGDGTHKLWKIRHPLSNNLNSRALKNLFQGLLEHIKSDISISAKIVVFLSEHEMRLVDILEGIGMSKEATYSDYYRVNEVCYVYCITVCKSSK